MLRIRLLWCLVAALPVFAGPVEFGMAEVNKVLAERGLKRIPFKAEINAEPPESYRIAPGLVLGGDLRGLMYGLLEAADQIRETGRLRAARGTPATSMRGIRVLLHNADLEREWYYSREYWQEFFAMLARNRFNRFNLVFAHQTAYLAPPYPFWIALDEFPGVRAIGLTNAERERNLEMLRYISDTAAEYAIDFTLGIWEHNIQRGMTPSVEGLTRENVGPYSYAALKKVLQLCPAIRSVQMRTNSESGIPNDQQVEFYRDYVFRAIRDTGRRVALDLRGWLMSGGMADAAKNAGVPLRLSSKYWAEDLGRPYQPAETFGGYSYLNFLEKPRPYEFYWELWGLGSHRLLLWGDPDYVRRAVPTFTLSGSTGFEIDPPLAQKGFGNRPGTWGMFTEAHKDRQFWKREFERYWLFYTLWGRLSYDPAAPERLWTAELRRRFGPAAPDVLEAYRASSGVLTEIVAAHLADPNMYVWPEINPGGLIDAYKDVRPSDWRFIASIPEAVENRIRGVSSAKQTALDTARILTDLAARTEGAMARASSKLGASNGEWRGSEPDFRVLAMLARYHAHKQRAAYNLETFYRTADAASLRSAKTELNSAAGVWEKLAGFTDGLYPVEMAFGPDDAGHWKDKLPYVRHDLKTVAERESILERFGHFDFGFDFGGPVAKARSASYRSDPYVIRNTVEPRFEAVDPKSAYSEATGFGWLSDGEREAHVIAPSPYLEVRAVAREPKRLPENALYGDWIQGRGPQVFRVKCAEGDYSVLLVKSDRSASESRARSGNGYLDIAFPEGEWAVSGIVIKGPRSYKPAAPLPEAKEMRRPAFAHTPPKTATAGLALALALRITPAASAAIVRLHYRSLNQLAMFKSLDAPAAKPVFTIPAEDVSARWDLIYYFEVLNAQHGGWFYPDPAVATPYFVVKTEAADKAL